MTQYNNSNKVMGVKDQPKNRVICMKTIFCLLLLFSACFSYGQENIVKRPERVIIANNEIITMEQLMEYEKEKRIGSMHNGVSDEMRDRLLEILGDNLPPKEFIFNIELRTEEEMLMLNKIEYAPAITVNDSAIDFTVKMIDGTTVKLSDLKGSVVLLNFWATWCAPCIREFYAFPSEIIEPFKNSEFVLLSISSGERETEEKVKNKMAELKKNGVDFNVGIDPDQSIGISYSVKNLPTNILIDKNSVVRYISTGYDDESLSNIASTIKSLLEE
jgi:Peroxiredoxin